MKSLIAVITALFMVMFLIGFTSALVTLKPAEINEPYLILQTCSGAGYINISVSNLEGLVLTNKEMINNGSVWYYNFTPDTIGRHDVSYISDGCEMSGASYFDVTGNGKNNPDGVIVVLFSICFLITMGFLVYSLILSIGHFASLDLDVVDLSKSVGVFFALLGFYELSRFYLGNPVLEDWLLLFIKIGGFTHIIIPLTGFLISITVGSLRKKKIDFGVRRILRRQKI